jgi:hypothetical protein
MVRNDSRNVRWAGDIYGDSGGNCLGYGYVPWGTIHYYKCNHYRVAPYGGRLGGFHRPPGWGGFFSRYDVDLFTFPNTHYHYWGGDAAERGLRFGATVSARTDAHSSVTAAGATA